MIPSYTFLQRDAAKPLAPKQFTDVLISTGKFYRDERGTLKFKVAPNDYLVVESRNALREILLSGDVVEMRGELGADDFAVMWQWFTSRKFAFPRLNPNAAYNPPAPKPVAHLRPEERYTHGRDCAPVRK